MNTLFLPEFIEKVLIFVITSAAALSFCSIVFFMNVRKINSALTSTKKGQEIAKDNMDFSMKAVNKYFRIYLPVFATISIAWFSMALWFYDSLHTVLFSSSFSIGNNLQQALNALSFADLTGVILVLSTLIFMGSHISLIMRNWKQMLKKPLKLENS